MREYFSHDIGAVSDPKIQLLFDKFKAKGYGLFWVVIEILAESENYEIDLSDQIFKIISFRTKENKKIIKEFLKFSLEIKIFSIKEKKSGKILENFSQIFKNFENILKNSENKFQIFSKSLKNRLEKRNSLIESRKEKSRTAINSRWNKSKESKENQAVSDKNTETKSYVSNAKSKKRKYERNTNVIRTYNKKNTDVIRPYEQRHTNKNKIKLNKNKIKLKEEAEASVDFVNASIGDGDRLSENFSGNFLNSKIELENISIKISDYQKFCDEFSREAVDFTLKIADNWCLKNQKKYDDGANFLLKWLSSDREKSTGFFAKTGSSPPSKNQQKLTQFEKNMQILMETK